MRLFFSLALIGLFTSLSAQETGCTYIQADNYSSTATVDDGTCVFECITCGEGTILNENTQTCIINVSYCSWQPDSNADGLVGVSDLLDFLLVYGDADSDGDGVYDTMDDCIDLSACNYQSNPTQACSYLDAIGVCAGNCLADADEDGVCDFLLLTDANIHEAVDLWITDEVSAEATYGHISDWDVSSVTYMSNLFYSGISFNGDISSWDVSSVTDMWNMFRGATNFNGDISSWDVSSVVGMNYMFQNATSFNGDLSSWDVSSVTSMDRMFFNASSFNRDLSSWDVSSVANMYNMFLYTPLSEENKCLIHTSFSSNAHWPYDWSEFCDSDGDGVDDTIDDCIDLLACNYQSTPSQPCSYLDAIGVCGGNCLADIDEDGICDLTPITNDNIHEAVDLWITDEVSAEANYSHISEWDVSSVTNMSNLFYSAISFNGDLSYWDVSSVTDMWNMFRGATNFNGDISSWDVSSVVGMNYMFQNATSFNGDLSSWDVSSVTSMDRMFFNASSFNRDLSSWDVSSVANMYNMFLYTPLSEENKCLIHTSFSSNAHWPYDWSEYCD